MVKVTMQVRIRSRTFIHLCEFFGIPFFILFVTVRYFVPNCIFIYIQLMLLFLIKLHVNNTAVAFVKALLQAHPPALVTTVKDIIPAMDGVALADPESWSGE